jgi:ACS family tartrate transporter-like MFS transporter
MEGLPAVVLGGVVLVYLPNGPDDARWLTERERAFLIERVRLEKEVGKVDAKIGAIGRTSVSRILTSGRVWMFGVTYFCIVSALYGITFWMPTILQGLTGLSDFTAAALSALPYLVGAIGMVFIGRHSDSTGERRWHVASVAFAGAAGFILSAMTESPPLALAAISIAAFGIFSAMPVFWAMPTAALAGTGAAAGIALINAIGNLGGFLGPYAIGLIRTATHSFSAGLIALAAALAMGGLLALTAY